MNRSQKRSVVVSTGLHLSLFLLVLLAGPAFFSAKPKTLDLPPIDFTPIITTDTDQHGGGSPGPHAPAPQPVARPVVAPAPAVDRPIPVPTPPKPIPRPVTPPHPKPPVEDPEPVKTPIKEPIKNVVKTPVREPFKDFVEDHAKPTPVKPSTDSLEPARPARRKPNIDPQITTRETASEIEKRNQKLEADRKLREWKRQQEEEDQQERDLARRAQLAAKERRDKALGLLKDLSHFSEGVPSSGTAVHLEMEGPGGEGVPYGNFLLGVQHVYQRDWQPRIPHGATDTELSVLATVTIARDGAVLEAKLTQSSGNREVDDSVNATLNNVRQAVPLPEKAKESQRSITIEFNVKPKRLAG